jgi:hypothetical protein
MFLDWKCWVIPVGGKDAVEETLMAFPGIELLFSDHPARSPIFIPTDLYRREENGVGEVGSGREEKKEDK